MRNFEVFKSVILEEMIMNNAISRRTFLKCAGAATVAAGAASLLGGCSLIDNVINAATKDVPSITMDGVTFTVTNAFTQITTTKTESGETKAVNAVLPLVGIIDGNQIVSSNPRTVSKGNFKLTIDGVEAEAKVGKEAEKIVNDLVGEGAKDLSKLNDKGQLALDGGLASVALVFVPKKPIEKWSKAVLTISYSNRSQNFELTYKSAFETDVVKK